MFNLTKELIGRVTLDVLYFIIQILCIIELYNAGNKDYIGMAIGNLIFWFVYIVIEWKQGWRIPLYIRFITLVSISSNDVLGDLLNLYISSALFDRIQHIFGTYSLTLWAFFWIQQFITSRFNQKRFIVIFIVSLSITFGTLYEFIEFFLDTFTNPTVKNQPSLLDTDLDLLSDFAGGIAALIHYLFSKSLQFFSFPFESKMRRL